MGFKVYGSEAKKQVFLMLEECSDGEVILKAVNKEGGIFDSGYILSITPDGKIKMHLMVNRTLGFILDRHGKVEIKDLISIEEDYERYCLKDQIINTVKAFPETFGCGAYTESSLNKIKIIKFVRQISSLGLKEAKELVESIYS